MKLMMITAAALGALALAACTPAEEETTADDAAAMGADASATAPATDGAMAPSVAGAIVEVSASMVAASGAASSSAGVQAASARAPRAAVVMIISFMRLSSGRSPGRFSRPLPRSLPV